MFKPFKTALQKKLTGGVIAFLCVLLRIRKPHKGGILIEFTFSIPLCIILLFFINDHYRFYELKNKIKNSTYLVASMVQHVTNTRTDKQLTRRDIINITYASCLNFFHTNTMFSPYPFGIAYSAFFYYIKRESSDSYHYERVHASTYGYTSFDKMGIYAKYILTKTRAQVEAMHPDLVCQRDGEERVLIECAYEKYPVNFDKSKLGFFILKPRDIRFENGSTNVFVYRLVITPKPGLFPVNYS